jgi:hypothetical protein
MRKLILTAAAVAFVVPTLALTLALPAGAAAETDPGSVSPTSATCGRYPIHLQDERVNDAAIHGPVMLRGATLVGCPVLGVLQLGDDAIYICYVGVPPTCGPTCVTCGPASRAGRPTTC